MYPCNPLSYQRWDISVMLEGSRLSHSQVWPARGKHCSDFFHSVLVLSSAAKWLQSCLTLWPHRWQPTRLPVPGILQARTMEWVAISFSNAWKWKVKVKSLSRVRLLSDPMDCSLSDSSVHGIFQARVLEWGAIAFSSFCLLVSCTLKDIRTWSQQLHLWVFIQM